MAPVVFRRRRWLFSVAAVCLLWPHLLVGRAAAYTPESPEVRAAVDKAVGFLESPAGTDDRMGARALIGLAVLKSGAAKDHPRIVEAVQAIQREVKPGYNPAIIPAERLYSPSVAVILLIELDAAKYASQIETLLEYLLSAQKSIGAWGYPPGNPHAATGDTSMSQYVVLAGWEAFYAGFHVPGEKIDRMLTWLLKTQDPSGGYGYQGVVSSSFAPVQQTEVSPSLTAAGLGTVYACVDLLKAMALAPGLPPALESVEDSRRAHYRSRVPEQYVKEVKSRGKRWLEQNYTTQSGQWTHYYLYALERYHSFREVATGEREEEPKWYNDGVSFLLETQQPDGAWEAGHSAAGEPVNTSFGILFLVRSMKESIERARNFGPGTMIGGRGLPKDTDAVIVRDGSVMSLPEIQAVESVLSVVGEGDDSEQYEKLKAITAMPSEDVTPLIDRHAEKLRRLAGDSSPEARLTAVRALAKRHSMDDVPVLIYALTDPDPLVVLAARDGLRRISRKFHGFGLPDDFTDAQRRAVIEHWKEWFLEVRPDAEFAQ